MPKKWTALLLCAFTLLALAACAGEAPPVTVPDTTPPSENITQTVPEPAPANLFESLAPAAIARRCDFLNTLLRVVVSPEVTEVKGGLFVSETPLTRDELAHILVNALKLQGEGSYEEVAAAAGLLDPAGDSLSNRRLTNAECAATIQNIIDKIVSEGEEQLETERKFLIDAGNLPFKLTDMTGSRFLQTYINLSPEVRVRKINGDEHRFAVKLPKDEIGLSRQEVQFLITEEEYDYLYAKRETEPLDKTRYTHRQDGVRVSVDIYDGHLKGLAVAEIEFESVEAANAFVPFDWFIEDLTSDKRYKNANLAKDGLPGD